MPEGDTIFRAALALHRALAGKEVVRFESTFPALTRVHVDHSITGRTIEKVESRGKNLLMTLSGGLVLHTHMRMNGSWHIYRPSERWQRPARDMRILIATDAFVAVGFNVPVAEFLRVDDVARHQKLGSLGPDLLSDDFDRDAVARRLRMATTMTIGDALLNQQLVAGIGNVLKSETLFLAGVNPFAIAGSLTPSTLGEIVEVARRLLAMNTRGDDVTTGHRRTTGRLNPSEALWVYGRTGRACRKCRTRIQSKKTGLDARPTYWCPNCQTQAGSEIRN